MKKVKIQNRFKFSHLGVLLGFMGISMLFLSANLRAQPLEKKEGVTHIHYRAKNNSLHDFKVEQKVRENGQLQVVVFLIEDRGLFKTKHRILHGRDLDGDGYPETWFHEESGYITHIFKLEAPRQFDLKNQSKAISFAVKNTLDKIAEIKNDNFFLEALFGASRVLLYSAGEAERVKNETALSDIEYLSLEIMTNAILEGMGADAVLTAEMAYHYALAQRGLELNRAKMKEALGDDYWQNGAIDAVLYFSLAKVGQLTAKGFALVVERLPSLPFIAKASASFEAFTVAYQNRVETWLVKSGIKKITAKPIIKMELMKEIYFLSSEAIFKKTEAALRSLTIRSQFAGRVLNTVGSVLSVYKRGLVDEFRYTLLTQSIQVVAESISRKQNPIELFSNKDFVQDFLFMTNETIIQSGISVGSGSLLKKSGVIAVISVVDSGSMNLLVKGVADPKRVALDTGWEAIIGNAQTNLIDLNIIQALRRRGEITHNQKLVWVGYALASVDQFVGYLGYSKATVTLNDYEKKQKLKLVPIYAAQ